MELQQSINRFINSLLTMDRMNAKSILSELSEDIGPLKITSKLIVPALDEIGLGWEKGKLSLSQVYMAGRICEQLIDGILKPESPLRIKQPRIGICVLQDHHILGKRVIQSALRASGYDVIDLGHGLSIMDIIKLTQEKKIQILMISVLMLPSALQIKEITNALKPEGVITIVGGAPFRLDDNLVNEVGADYTGNNAGKAITIVNKIVEEYNGKN